uniref:Uncharacterized protein n=1 Tax=Sphaerodactylus townsendi TaxID=933632 RepID=A0ACB8EV52_9SAUR
MVVITMGVSVAETPLLQSQPPESPLGGVQLNREPCVRAELEMAALMGPTEPVTSGSGTGSKEIDPGAAEVTIVSARPDWEGGAPQDALVTWMKEEYCILSRQPPKHQRPAVEHHLVIFVSLWSLDIDITIDDIHDSPLV